MRDDGISVSANAQGARAELMLSCDDLAAALAFYIDQLGFRLDMIMPADAPRFAVVSGFGIALRLKQREASPAEPSKIRLRVDDHEYGLSMPTITRAIIKRADGDDEWSAGRAGMSYRDLITDRIGGKVIASQIRIEHGGPVDDYVHFHKVGLQLIYCRRGWVRVVYEDQGPSFVMQPGDCVLQPPTIRHRVLESSAGLEVIELGIPAEHETWRDHVLSLPTASIKPLRDFGGQRFVRHIAAESVWKHDDAIATEFRDFGIDEATNGFASARELRLHCASDGTATATMTTFDVGFLFVLDGAVQVIGTCNDTFVLQTDHACVLASHQQYVLSATVQTHVLSVCVSTTPPASH